MPEQEALHFTGRLVILFGVLRVGKLVNKASAGLKQRLVPWPRLPPSAADAAGSCHFLSPAADGVPTPPG